MPVESFVDQTGFEVSLKALPSRIVSLVPSQTELLYDLGLESKVVGITRYCVHPTHWAKTKTIVGGTKTVEAGAIERLRPDLIIGNKEENERSLVEELRKKYPVWISDVGDLNGAREMILSVGSLTGTSAAATAIVSRIDDGFARLAKSKPQPLKVLYLVWRKPWMGAGGDTFISAMLQHAGMENCLAGQRRYPELTASMLPTLVPDIVLLSTEPFPFKQKHVEEVSALCPESKVVLVDGELFSWYGSRLIHAAEYFGSPAWNQVIENPMARKSSQNRG